MFLLFEKNFIWLQYSTMEQEVEIILLFIFPIYSIMQKRPSSLMQSYLNNHKVYYLLHELLCGEPIRVVLAL